MPTTRANFLKGLLSGIAAAPLAAKTQTYAPKVEGSAKWKEKKWRANGINFREYQIPRTVAPTFEEFREDRPQHRIIWIPMFDREADKRSMRELVEDVIHLTAVTEERVKSGMPVVDEDGKPIEYGGYEKKCSNITIVKVDGYPHLLGIYASEHPLVPISDFYRDVAARASRIKAGMSKMKADYSHVSSS